MKSGKLTFIFAISLFLFSCLKSDVDEFGWNSDQGSIVVEIFESAAYGQLNFLFLAADPPAEELNLLTLKYHAPRALKPGGDIQVTLSEEPDLVNAYGLLPLPAGAVSIGTTTLTIPKATGESVLQMSVDKQKLSPAEFYGIAFSISSVSEGIVSELAKDIVVAIVVF